jgi:hypothetical protein
MDIPVSEYQEFWYALANQFGGNAKSGFLQAKKMAIGSVIRRYPTCYFDFEEVISRTIPLAAKSYDPSRGTKVTTHLCNVAQGVAINIIRTKSHSSKWEMPFADVDTEDKERIEEKNAVVDEPRTPVVEYGWIRERLKSKNFIGKCCCKTYWDLAADLRDGKSRQEIGKSWGITQPTLRKLIDELREYVQTIAPELIVEYFTD